jgi:hypothetical protein
MKSTKELENEIEDLKAMLRGAENELDARLRKRYG